MNTGSPTGVVVRKHLVPVLLLSAGGVLLGVSTNLAKLAGRIDLTPLAFLAWSVTGAAAILLALAVLRGKLPPIDQRSLQYYAVSALVSVAGSNFIFFAAIPHVGASFVALIITLPPLLTYLGALAFGLERFQTVRAAGVVAALAGAAVLAVSQLTAAHTDISWILFVLVGPVLLAIGNLYRTLRWPVGVAADALAPGMLMAASVLLLLAGLLPGHSLDVPLDDRLPFILIMVQAAIFAGQFQLLFMLQKSGGPVLLSLLGSVGAVVAVPAAILLQNEAAPPGLLLSAVLIAAGVAMVSLGQARVQAGRSKDLSIN